MELVEKRLLPDKIQLIEYWIECKYSLSERKDDEIWRDINYYIARQCDRAKVDIKAGFGRGSPSFYVELPRIQPRFWDGRLTKCGTCPTYILSDADVGKEINY